MRLDLNLAREEDRPRGWQRAAWWAAATLLVAAASTAHGLYYRTLVRFMAPEEARLQALEAEAKRVEAQGGVPAETREELAALPARVEAFNRILVAATFPWSGLLVELEAALPPNVGLTAIQPDPASGTVTLQGLAKTFADLTVFVNMLEGQESFHEVQLMRHSQQGRGPGDTAPLLEFSIRLLYQPGEPKGPPGAS